jgi:hypothetical protein
MPSTYVRRLLLLCILAAQAKQDKTKKKQQAMLQELQEAAAKEVRSQWLVGCTLSANTHPFAHLDRRADRSHAGWRAVLFACTTTGSGL